MKRIATAAAVLALSAGAADAGCRPRDLAGTYVVQVHGFRFNWANGCEVISREDSNPYLGCTTRDQFAIQCTLRVYRGTSAALPIRLTCPDHTRPPHGWPSPESPFNQALAVELELNADLPGRCGWHLGYYEPDYYATTSIDLVFSRRGESFVGQGPVQADIRSEGSDGQSGTFVVLTGVRQ